MDIIVKDGNAYVAMTHERIEAIKRALVALEYEQREFSGISYPTKRDFEIEKAMGMLESIIEDAELEERWQNATFLDDKPEGWAGVANA